MTRDNRLLWTLQCLMLLAGGRLVPDDDCRFKVKRTQKSENAAIMDIEIYIHHFSSSNCWTRVSQEYRALVDHADPEIEEVDLYAHACGPHLLDACCFQCLFHFPRVCAVVCLA